MTEQFLSGSAAEERACGSVRKHRLLAGLHRAHQPTKYLEIGVQAGVSFKLAQCRAVGVDPELCTDLHLPPDGYVVQMTSDDFFSDNPDLHLLPPPDLSFIDGMHLFEFALRDFMNVEKWSREGGIIVIDDVYPGHPAQAERERRTRAWTGDVWKLHLALETFRPDLTLSLLDAHPTGLLVIENIDPTNDFIRNNYETILEEFLHMELREEIYVHRTEAMDPVRWYRDRFGLELESL